MLQIKVEISPINFLLCKYNISKFESFPILIGIMPQRKLLSKLSAVKLTRFPISEGMLPVSWFPPNARNLRLVVRLTIKLGNVPPKLL